MKNLRMLLLLAATMINTASAAVNLEEYFIGDRVDAEGKTFLHKYAEHSDKDTFKVELDLFNDLDKKLVLEAAKLQQEAELYSMLPGELRDFIMFMRVAEVVMAKDKNDDTALDIFKRKSAVPNPCNRCVDGMEKLQEFHDLMEQLK